MEISEIDAKKALDSFLADIDKNLKTVDVCVLISQQFAEALFPTLDSRSVFKHRGYIFLISKDIPVNRLAAQHIPELATW